MAKDYLGAKTPFGVIVKLESCLYNPTATIEAKDGTRTTHKLPKLIALGITAKEAPVDRHAKNR